jgi:hypothetical protein
MTARRLSVLFALLFLNEVPQIFAYGPEGHQLIGAVADRLLTGTPTGAKVSRLLDGYTLREVAIIPDTIKQWDVKGLEDPTVQLYFSSHPQIAEQLRDFWQSNPPTYDAKPVRPSHRWFHYTDVPLADPLEKYASGKTGRSQWDIVHMMRYCIEILKGTRPENNPRGITKPIALILLAHLVGDIHQPLHVGAEYFTASGRPADPNKPGQTYPDEGGNSLRLQLKDPPPRNASKHPRLHGFWDTETVFANLPEFPPTMPKLERREKMDIAEIALSRKLAAQPPKHWRLPPEVPVEKYPEVWADEILPIARQAHLRLQFAHVQPTLDHESMVADGDAVERSMPDEFSYREWSAQVVLNEIHLAGWRLADLLRQTLNAAPSR